MKESDKSNRITFIEYYFTLSPKEKQRVRDEFLKSSGISYPTWYSKLNRNNFSILEMSIEEFNKQVESLSEIGYSIIEKLAREVMDKNKRISYFTMAMGVYFFSDYDGHPIDEELGRSGEYGAYKYYKKSIFYPLNNFLSEHNEAFKFTEMPMHFVRDGEIITDW